MPFLYICDFLRAAVSVLKILTGCGRRIREVSEFLICADPESQAFYFLKGCFDIQIYAGVQIHRAAGFNDPAGTLIKRITGKGRLFKQKGFDVYWP